MSQTKLKSTSRTHTSVAKNRLAGLLKSRWFYPSLLVAVAVITHWPWFTIGTTLFHGDWSHWPTYTAGQAWSVLGTWNSFYGLGTPRILIGFTVMQNLWSLIVQLGGTFDTAVKLSLLIPVAILGFIAPYLLVKKIVNDKFIAFVVAIFYGSTTYFLIRQGSHVSIASIYAFSPIIFLLFINAIEKLSIQRWIVFGLAYALGVCYEVRIMYIVTFMLALYACFFMFKKGNVRRIVVLLGLTAAVIGGLSAFWALPTLFGGAQSTISQTASRGLFGSDLFDLQHALTLSSSGWTGGIPDETFEMQPVLLHLWVVPVLALIPFVLFNQLPRKLRALTIYFAVIALLGIFLSKQETAPLPGAYEWLYSNFPGFSLFREASKFYLIIAWGYMGLLAISLYALKNLNIPAHKIAATALIAVGMINLFPLPTGNFHTLFAARNEPTDYKEINRITAKDPDTSRTLWVPSQPQWGYFDLKHPIYSAVNISEGDWLRLLNSPAGAIGWHIKDALESPFAMNLLKDASIKYIGVPLRDPENDDDFMKYYGDDRQYYLDILAGLPWIEEVKTSAKEVVLYELKGFKRHISTYTEMFSLTSLENFGRTYSFGSSILSEDFQFTATEDTKSKNNSNITEVFHGIKFDSVRDGKITQEIKSLVNPTLFINTNKPSYSYRIASGGLDLFAVYANNVTANNKTFMQNRTDKLGSIRLEQSRSYYFALGHKLFPFDRQNDIRTLGEINEGVRIASASSQNLVSNGSFERGTWGKKVQDCNNHDGKPDISMSLSNAEHTDGSKSLKLGASQHTPCVTSDPVPVTRGAQYLLSFDYKVKGGREVGYQIESKSASLAKENIPVKSQSWHTFSRIITIPAGTNAINLKLLGLPDDRNKSYSITHFDNVKISPLRIDLDPKINPAAKYTPVSLQSSEVNVTLKDATASTKNLIPNPSLEKGTWAKDVGDCDAYDDNPQLKMTINKKERTQGNNSLELSAKRHTACTGPGSINVEENATYLLSFDYQSPNGKHAGYYIGFNDPDGEAMSDQLKIEGKEWHHFAQTIKTPIGASRLNLAVYSYPERYTSQHIINRYDNFKLIRIPNTDGKYFIASEVKKLTNPEKIDFQYSEPTNKKVQITKATTSFYVAMSELFHPDWRLSVNNGKVQGINSWVPWAKPDAVPDEDHFKLNDFQNGWYVDVDKLCKQQNLCVKNADGSYNIQMVAEFTPQRWFYIGLIISGLTLAGCLGYLGWCWIRRRTIE
jgi:hypothetical protein